jgi:uracil-DNA glycosylase
VCAPFLRRCFELAAPRLIVAMGATAARLATGERASLRKLRGRWVEEAPGGASLASIAPVLPMFHPAAVQRQPACRKEAWADLISLRKRLDGVSLAGEGARPSS